MAEEKTTTHSNLWQNVQTELLKNDASANKMAVLETEKIFQKAVQDKNLPGKDIEDGIRNYANLFSNYDKLKYSRAMYEKLITKPGFRIPREDAEDIIKGYRDAITDLERVNFDELPLTEKINLFVRRNFYGFPGKIKNAVLALISLSVLTFILTETETGRALSSSLVAANNYLFYKILPAILLLLLATTSAIVIFYIYRNKNK